MVFSFKDCQSYLSEVGADEQAKVAICIGSYHFAHHFWNELSGLRRQQKAGLLNRADTFFVTREPLGQIDEIFPEIHSKQVERVATTDDLFREVLVGRYLAVRVGGDFIDKELGSRVQQVARRHALPSTFAAIEKMKAECSPLLWVGVRIGNRAWTDQAEGLSNLIQHLRSEFPKLGVVFDGFSLPADRIGGDEELFLIDQENAVVVEIIERLRQKNPNSVPTIFNTIGSSIFDALMWANAIDVYLAPYGSLQHKVGWFANKPGVIHSNSTLLKEPARYVWAAVENAIQPIYISEAYVKDLSGVNDACRYNEISDASSDGAGIRAMNSRVRERPEFNNYAVDVEALHDALSHLLKSRMKSRRIKAGFPDRVLQRGKVFGKKMVWRFTDMLDVF